MNREFIPYEEALALKELGFLENVFGCYFLFKGEDEKPFLCFDDDQYHIEKDNPDMVERLPTPLYQQAFRWFRDKHKLTGHVIPCVWIEDYFCFDILTIEEDGFLEIKYEGIAKDSRPTYEEAELACLRKLIEIVKDK